MTVSNLTTLLLECFNLQNEATRNWHDEEPQDDQPEFIETPNHRLFTQIVLAQHLANFQLWHVEDVARRRDITSDAIADCKRQIDSLNQKRNDRMERIDSCFLALIQPLLPQNTNARLNTESLGMAVDRASILSLKIWHMREQTERDDASSEHASQCKRKLDTLNEQREDLTQAVLELVRDFHRGDKTPKIYYQHKMYNDPNLNPELYRNTK